MTTAQARWPTARGDVRRRLYQLALRDGAAAHPAAFPRLACPADVSRLEFELIGGRELRGAARRKKAESLEGNAGGLPEAETRLCRRLRDSLNGQDGFRRKAVPVLLYRCFASMRNGFRTVRGVTGAPFALIVGHNHTALGGARYDIDTPSRLAALAAQTGWKVDGLMPLRTYRRYGCHVGNAVRAETLVVLSNP